MTMLRAALTCSLAGRNGWAKAMTRKNTNKSLEASTRYCFNLLFWVVSSFICLSNRLLEKKTRVVFLKLKRWTMMGMERAVSAQRN